jgi:hypothetical protein
MVRRLPAGGNRIRTIGPAEGARGRRGIGSRRANFSVGRKSSRDEMSPSGNLVVPRGTDDSNPACSSGESAANLTLGAHPTARLPPHVSLARNSRLCDGLCADRVGPTRRTR